MRRATWTILLLAASLSSCCAQQMAGMLENGPFPTMSGRLLRLIEGPVTGGDRADVAIADLNSDGRPDLLLGSGYGDLLYYRQVSHGIFAPPDVMIGSSAVVSAWPPRLRQVSPEVMDWDGDTRPDLVLGWDGGLVWYTWSHGRIGTGQPMTLGDGQAVAEAIREAAPQAGHLAPTAGDLDGDGDADLLLGADDGSVWWLEHTAAGAWGTPGPVIAGGQPLVVGRRARICLADWDDDGNADLLLGDADGKLWLCRSAAGTLSAPAQIALPDEMQQACLAPRLSPDGSEVWLGTAGGLIVRGVRSDDGGLAWRGFVRGRQPPLDVGQAAAVSALDWDGDGDLDVLAGNRRGQVQLFERVDGSDDCLLQPGKAVRAVKGIVQADGGYSWPRCADADGDGDVDLFVGGGAGLVELWINSGTFVRAGALSVAGRAIRTAAPALVVPCDYDRDGDVDLFVGSKPQPAAHAAEATIPPGSVAYFENVANNRHSLPVFSKGTLLGITIERSGMQADLDAIVLGPQVAEALDTTRDGTTRFLLLADLGVFLFTTTNSRGAYPFLRAASPEWRLPAALVPPVYSACACNLYNAGTSALLCGTDQYGMVLVYSDWLPAPNP